jgi:hypothetical protein
LSADERDALEFDVLLPALIGITGITGITAALVRTISVRTNFSMIPRRILSGLPAAGGLP